MAETEIKLSHWAFEVTGCRDCTRNNEVCPVHEMQRDRVISELRKYRAAYDEGYKQGMRVTNEMHALKVKTPRKRPIPKSEASLF